MSELSKCHKAPVEMAGRGDFDDNDRPVTMHYVCTKCGEACDLYVEPTHSQDSVEKLKQEINLLLGRYGAAVETLVKHKTAKNSKNMAEKAGWVIDDLLALISSKQVEARIDEWKQFTDTEYGVGDYLSHRLPELRRQLKSQKQGSHNG